MAAAGVYLLGLFGLLLRVGLNFTHLPSWLQTQNEVVTPLTSWKRVEEGFALQKQLISPYSGDIFHETPLALQALKIAYYFPWKVTGFFLFLDLLTMMFLYKTSVAFVRHLIQVQNEEKKKYSTKAESIILTTDSLAWIPTIVLACYSLNPMSIMTTLAMSTGAISNLTIILTFYYLLQGNRLLCTFFLSVSAYQSLYPLIFIVPVALYFLKLSRPSMPSLVSVQAVSSYVQTCALFFLFSALLIGLSFVSEGSWEFLYSTYGFILTVPDLTPNCGVFWYFFTEMFDHFRTFFVCVFQLNAVVYAVPLAVKFSEKPFFLMFLLIFVTSIFKSYPSYADASLYFSLLPLWKHTFSYMRNTLVVGGMYVCCGVLAPILYHLWIFAGSANANFYFAITLTYSAAQIFLVTDLLFAYLRREYDLYNGTEHQNKDGSKAQIILE
ncbi:phosphatidylinositol glycan anchor biosynthesis class U protein [Aplysia californica]|uniref:Phosphatidylinositol glycan anchor biosynthesis class U protein n=1 Tax=Aplysia californica TaxID=6500 RepID=A0ABM0JDM5_APLCA|nr:phosphatidylinositol glycan anchor biosynthesis class U protein [Aplysia californica]